MVNVARCRYGPPAGWESTSRHRSRRPNMPFVQPCDGSSRNAAATKATACAGGSNRTGTGRPNAANIAACWPGGAYPVAAWWWSIAITRTRCVLIFAGQSARNPSTVAGSAGNAVRPVASHQSVNHAQSSP